MARMSGVSSMRSGVPLGSLAAKSQLIKEAPKNPAPLAGAMRLMLLLLAGHRGLRQNGRIRITVPAADRTGSRSHLEPLQQGFRLWVERAGGAFLFDENTDCGIRQDFHRIASLQVILVGLGIGRLPTELPIRRRVFDEGIIERLGSFVREGGHILESRAK